MRKLVPLVLVLGLVAASCSDTSGNVIASVGGAEITEDDVGSLFESDTLPIDDNLREAIFALVAREVLLIGLSDDFAFDLDSAAVEASYAELVGQMEAAGMSPEEFLAIPDASTEMLRFNAEIGVIRQQAIEGTVAQPETIEMFFSEPAAYTTVCARHILVETEDDALDVLARLDAGEDFAAVAADVSLDSPSGDLGCSLAARYVTEFAEATMSAEIGEFTGPVVTTFGHHVLVVDDRSAPTEEEFVADPLAHLTAEELNTLWGRWLNTKLDTAEVTLDPKYGTWTDVGILPPEAGDGDE